MDKNGTLTISNFQQGISDSPLLGFSKIVNLEVFEKQGIAKIQPATVLEYATASLPVAFVNDDFGNQYAGCEGGHFYVNGTDKSGHANPSPIYDLKVIADPSTNVQYILISRYTDLAIWGPLNTVGAQLFESFGNATLATGYGKPIVVGQDNIVYIGNGNSIMGIPLGNSVTGAKFHSQPVGTVPTMDGTPLALPVLTLPQGHYCRSMAELGKWLMIGTQGGSNFSQSPAFKKSYVIPWDRTSPTFNLPVILHENGINMMLQIANQLYINAGTRGRMYVTDSTNYQQFKRIPFSPDRQFGTYLVGYPNAIQFHNGELLFGASTGGDSYPSKSIMGVYSLFLTPVQIGNSTIQYPLVLRNSPSSGGLGTTQPLKIGAIYSTSNDQLFIGWQDGSSYGVDVFNFPVYTGYQAFIDSQFYTVGSVLNKRTFKTMEISLTNPLVAGQQIRISWRANLNDSWTIIRDINGNKDYFDSTNFSTSNTFISPANLASLVKLQIKIELNQGNLAFGNNIELEYISFSGGKE